MKLRQNGNDWEIEGFGKERARLAYAVLDGKHIVYELPDVATSK